MKTAHAPRLGLSQSVKGRADLDDDVRFYLAETPDHAVAEFRGPLTVMASVHLVPGSRPVDSEKQHPPPG